MCMTPFHIAAGHENIAFGKIAATLILHCGGDPNKTCDGGRTVLHVAIAWNRWHVVRVILDNPYILVDLRVKDDEGFTPFDYAIKFNAWESLAELRSQNENVQYKMGNNTRRRENYFGQELHYFEQNKFPKVQLKKHEIFNYYNLSTQSGYNGSESSLDSSNSIIDKININHDYEKCLKDSCIRNVSLFSTKSINLSQEDLLNTNVNKKNLIELSKIYHKDNLIGRSSSFNINIDNDCLLDSISFPLMNSVSDTKTNLSYYGMVNENFDLQNDLNFIDNDSIMTDISNLTNQAIDSDSDNEYFTCPEKNSLENSEASSSKSIEAICNAFPNFNISDHTNSKFLSNILVEVNTSEARIINSTTSSIKSSSLTEITDDCDTDDVRQNLRSHGIIPGPILPGTKRLYLRRLKRLLSDQVHCNQYPTPNINYFSGGSFSQQLEELFKIGNSWKSVIMSWSSLECDIVCNKSGSSFTYLLLDPRVTENLPNRVDSFENSIDVLIIFIRSIFYIGKGTNARPNDHMREAFNEWVGVGSNNKVPNPKIEFILNLWRENKGVVCVQAFHHLTSKEAHIREAAMIDAIGLNRLTNEKRGTYYNKIIKWKGSDKCKLGCYLLYRAMLLLLADGERQLRPVDLT
ncbi:uncharacterized protein LOC126899136 isoform X2 [Daktulosphaira vitifoliae]|nr:uncharacterized protein LOC126899136 isoform X2 [Daktulosphaira vitifoliae]